jgi:hypothetical protein
MNSNPQHGTGIDTRQSSRPGRFPFALSDMLHLDHLDRSSLRTPHQLHWPADAPGRGGMHQNRRPAPYQRHRYHPRIQPGMPDHTADHIISKLSAGTGVLSIAVYHRDAWRGAWGVCRSYRHEGAHGMRSYYDLYDTATYYTFNFL